MLACHKSTWEAWKYNSNKLRKSPRDQSIPNWKNLTSHWIVKFETCKKCQGNEGLVWLFLNCNKEGVVGKVVIIRWLHELVKAMPMANFWESICAK